MTVTIKLPRKLETRLRARAAKAGVDAEAYVVRALESDLRRPAVSDANRLPPATLRLIEDMNAGLPQELWTRYHELIGRRDEEKLTSRERRELLTISDRIEEANAKRARAVADYAAATGKSFRQVLKQFEIGELADA